MICRKPISLKQEIDSETGEIKGGINVPCGKCLPCLQRKRSHWSLRLYWELQRAHNSTFLTLTYNDKYLPKDKKLNKKHLQNYFKRVRTKEPKLKYYAVGEYGSKAKRPHYHAIVYNADPTTLLDKWRKYKGNFKDKEKRYEEIGRISCDPVNEATIHYVTKYIVDESNIKKDNRPFSICSDELGANYAEIAGDYHRNNHTFITVRKGGEKNSIPRYIREKIYNEDFVETKRKKYTLEDGKIKEEIITEKQYEKNSSYYKSLEKAKAWVKEQEAELLKETPSQRRAVNKRHKVELKKQSKSLDT